MGKLHPELDQSLRDFIAAQHLFFVATAPLGADGHINLSPKGLDCFRILGPRQVAYLDHTGSGVETVAHLRENGRLTIMFCAFDGRPNILRLYGRGRVVEPGDSEFADILSGGGFAPETAVRSIIFLDVTRIATSCGFGVPLYEYKGDRDQIVLWGERKGPEAILAYQREKNAVSIDGLPGLKSVSVD